jgi:speckle-type POZ protein
LRGDPHQRNSFSVLVNYRDGTHPLEIIKVDMNRNQIGDDISELTRCAVSPNLSKDLNNILDDRANCDLLLCPCTHFSTLSSSSNNMNENGNKSGQQQYENKMGDGNQILVNGAIISARCHVLAQLISDEKKRLTKNDISGGKENEESYTATDILKVIVPSDVAWDTVPKVIEYLYTDNIDLSNNLLSKYHPEYDVALELHGIINNEIKKDLRSSTEGNISTPTPTPTPTPTRQTAPTSRKRPKKHGISKTKFVALFNLNYIERLLISANILELPAFGELVEWWCAEVICIANVERIATLAHHVGAVQLLDSAICFMVEHLPVILNFNNVSSTVVDKDKAPYYFLRLPMLVRVRVAVIYSCSIRLLDRDACCDKVHTTDEGKSQSFEETKNTRKTTVQEFANDKSLLAVLYAIWPSFDENNATINVNDLDNRFVKLTKNGISTLKTACKYGSENLLSEKFLGTNSEMMNHEKKAQAITMLQEALIDANRWFQNCKKYQEAPSESKIHAYYKTKFEDSLQRFADQAVLRSAQHDQLETNRKVKDFPEEQGVIPSCTGHKTLIVKGNRMLALGGGNRYSYMSLGHILSYHITTGVWSKLPTSGSPPSRLLHHAAAVIDEADPTHVIILGGTRKRESNLYLLDSIRMRWSKLKSMDQKDDNGCNTINILGKAMSPRAGHTITSLTENISFLSSKQYSKKSTGREKFLVIFGGYSNEDSTFYNDIHVICALQTHFNSPSSHQNQKTLSDTYYTFSWRDNIIVTGSAPEPRLAHSCTTIRPMPYKINTFDTEIGSRLLIIFGGVGSSNIYCDVNVLDTSQLTRNNHHLRWMETNVQGEKPAPRYGHTAVALDQENVAIFGGIARTPMPFNEIFILNFVNVKIVDSSNHSAVCNFIWSKIDVSGGCPCPRFRHTAVLSRNDCNTNDQNSVVKILVFGGTTRMNNRPLKPLDPQSVDTNLHQLIIQRTNQIRNNDKNMEKQMYEKYTWVVDQVEWEEIQTRFLYLPTQMNRTPICQSSSFASDIASMLDACNENLIDFSDINLIPTLSIVVEDINDDGNNNKIKEETQQIAELVRAHRIILTARSKRFRAMLMSGMQESRLGRVVCDMSYNVLFELVQFLYSDTVSVKALNEPHLLMRLLVVAGEYTLEKLAKVCEGVLLRLLDPENAAEFLEFSTFYNCTVFRSGTLSFILRNFQSVEKTAGFKELSKELKKEVFDKRDAVNVYKYKEICVSPTATGKK